MAYQVKTTTSYGKRVGGSFKNIISGFVVIVIGTVLLFWNEGRTVKTAKMLKHAAKECVHIPDVNTVDPSFNGKMIHANGLATTDQVLTDTYFGVFTPAIKLIREVEYYQWVENATTETKDKIGGKQETTTTYTYSKEWVSSPVDSQSFADPDYQGRNSVRENIPDQELVASNVSFGAYTLPSSLVSQMHLEEPMNVEGNEDFAVVKKAAADSLCHVRGNQVYIGKNVNSPEIGDVRVRFTKVMPAEVSILARNVNNTFEPYTDKNGYSLCTLVTGTESMDAMFQSKKSSNKTMSWVLRILGIILLYIGFKMIFEFLVTILKVLPFLASIANLGTSIAAFALTFVWALVVIAIGWLFYRPVLGILLLALAGAGIWYFTKKGKEKAI